MGAVLNVENLRLALAAHQTRETEFMRRFPMPFKF